MPSPPCPIDTKKPQLTIDVPLGSPISFGPSSPSSSISSIGSASPTNFEHIASFPTPVAARADDPRLRSPPKPSLNYTHDMDIRERIASEYRPPVRTRSLLSREKRVVSTPVGEPEEEECKTPVEDHTNETYELNGRAYVYSRQLGTGTFSRVVAAIHGDETIAVKVLMRPENDPNFQSYVDREVSVLRGLKPHPSVIGLLGTGPASGPVSQIFLTYCCGGSLYDMATAHAARNQHNVRYWQAIRRVVVELLGAVSYLHSQLVIHRDLKLENVLLTHSFEQMVQDHTEGALINITDFGMSKRLDYAGQLLSTRCGSVDYVAQEILMGLEYDGTLTDAWSVGVMVYSLLEDRLPFDAPPEHYQPKGMSPSVRRRRAKQTAAHRIAMIDWDWYKEELGVVKPEIGVIVAELRAIAEGFLVRKDKRMTCEDVLKNREEQNE